MSERGSFTTEYSYCDKCIEALKPILCCDEKYMHGVPIPMYGGSNEMEHLPIIAGKVGGLWGGEEVFTFHHILRERIEAVICQDFRIAVLPENGSDEILLFKPSGKVEHGH